MKNNSGLKPKNIISWLLGLVVLIIGILNLIVVHPVPGIAFLHISLVLIPPVNLFLKSRLGFSIPFTVRVILGVAVVWFTLGVSDLGDMID